LAQPTTESEWFVQGRFALGTAGECRRGVQLSLLSV